jgi:hypothetical protein
MAERPMPTDDQIKAMNDAHEAAVVELCERVGYGFTIDVAARWWDAKLERDYGIKGHCAGWLAEAAKNHEARRRVFGPQLSVQASPNQEKP